MATRILIDEPSAVARLSGAIEAARVALKSSHVVVLGWTRSAADDVARHIALSEQATIGLYRFSLSQFASVLVRESLARARVAPASQLALDAIATHAAFEAVTAGELGRVREATTFPGFTRALRRTLTEIRLADLPLDLLHESGGPRGKDLSAIGTRYADALARHSISDVADLFSRATKTVEQTSPLLTRGSVILLDVAIHTAAERAFIAALVQASPNIIATVPPHDSESLQTLTRLKFKRKSTCTVEAPSQLDRLRDGLFADSRSDERPESDGTVTYFSAPGEGREAVEIARLVLREAERGIAFDRIAVALRSPMAYVAHLETAFRRANIPIHLARGTVRPDPSGRAFLALLACTAEKLSARRFAEYLSLGQVPAQTVTSQLLVIPDDETLAVFAATTDSDNEAAGPDTVPVREPWRWEELIVEAAVVGGTDRWERRLRGLAEEFAVKRRGAAIEDPSSVDVVFLDREIARLADLTAFALPTIRHLDALRTCTTWGDWIPQLEVLATATLHAPERVLAVLSELRPLRDVGPVSVTDVYRTLKDRLTTLHRRPPADRFGRIFVAPIEGLRGRSFDVVFVPGLAERAFPQRAREDPLLLDADRARLSENLTVQRDRVRRERLLLQLAIGGAAKRIYVSYPRMEVREARPRVSSFYALDIARATRGDIPAYDALERDARDAVRASMAWPAPPDARNAIDALEHDLATFRRLLELDPSQAHGRAQYLLRLNAPLGRALRARHVRWEVDTWQKQDGLIIKDRSQRALLDPYTLTEKAYSPSILQRFARCPYQFYLAGIQRLHVREEPPPIERMDARLRGTLLHEMYAAILRQLQQHGLLPVTADNWTSAEQIADAQMDRIAAAYRDDLAPAISAVWDADVQRLRMDIRLWLHDLITVTREWLPLHVELGFGVGLDNRDPASGPDPIAVTELRYLVKGAMDVVERAVRGPRVRVTDFKTGVSRLRRNTLVQGGELLQPVLYSLALEQLVDAPVAGGRLWFATLRGRSAEHFVPLDRRTRDAAAQTLSTIDDAVRGGFLPAAPKPEACGHCEFTLICGPYEEERVLRKKQATLAAVDDVRRLP